MAIQGPIRELGVVDLLQLLSLSRNTGRLEVVNAKSDQKLILSLEEGIITGLAGSPPELRIGRLLVLNGAASDIGVRRGLSEQTSRTSPRLGEILVEQLGAKEADVRRMLTFQIEEALFDLLRWDEGHIRFDEGSPSPVGRIQIRVPTDSALMDAVRRLDEWTEVTASDRTADPVPRLAATNDTRASALSLEPLHWRVLAEVDGSRTLRQIARTIGRAELDVARAIHSLVASEIVEFEDSSELGTASIAGEIEAASEALKQGDAEGARRRLRALLDSSPDSAEIHTLLGTAEARLGRLNEGVAHFTRAVELDPLYEQAYFHSAVTLVRQGKLDRAHEALTTFFRLANPGNALYARGKVLMVELSRTLEALKGSE